MNDGGDVTLFLLGYINIHELLRFYFGFLHDSTSMITVCDKDLLPVPHTL